MSLPADNASQGPAVLPLTALQSGILAASKSSSAGQLYVTQAVFALNARVETGRWADVWQQLVNRHEALRMVFVIDRPGEAVQVALESVEAKLQVHQLGANDTVTQFLAVERERGFDLGQAPLFRLNLVVDQNGVHHHAITFHHALLDGWSVELLMNEALQLYAGQPLDSAPTIRRYLGWYRKQQAAAGDYWERAFAGWEGPLALPGDRGDDGSGLQDQHFEHRVDGSTCASIRQLARDKGLTLNAVVCALWAAQLSRICGRDDVVIGVVSSGRDAPVADVARIAGLLMNAMPLRVRMPPAASAIELMHQVAETIGAAMPNAHLPVGDMLRRAGANAVGRPYDTMVVFEQVASSENTESELSNEGLRIADRNYFDQTSVPLSVLVFPEGESLLLKVQFNSQRLDNKFVRALVNGLDDALREVATSRDIALKDIRYGADRVPQPVLDYSRERVSTQILKCFEQHPTSPAVVHRSIELTYGQLAKRVGDIAAGIASRQLGQGDPVVVNMATGPDAVAAILGVVMSGHPYVYLDPAYPAAYQDRVLDVLAQEFGSDVLQITSDSESSSQSNGVGFDDLVAAPAPDMDRPLCPDSIEPHSLAYIVFTSGSSGMPKGVKVSHGNLDYSNAARSSVYAEIPQRFLLLSSFAFDSSVVGLFWTLSTGGTLVLPEDGLARSLDQIPNLIDRHSITHTLCLPSVYTLVLRSAGAGQLKTLKCVTVAGEACTSDVISLHREIAPSASLYNEYGPSEATVWCAAARVDNLANEVVVGAPPTGTSLAIVNRRREPLAEGVVGELVVTGPGVAQGYLGDVDQSGFFEYAGRKSYATGDLAVIDEGVVTLRGRIDAQVKVNGVRIELTDIESRLENLEGVESAAVVAIPGPDRRTRLVAHLTLSSVGMESSDTNSILDALRKDLPAAAIPAHVEVHSELPQLPNGKLDRKSVAQLAVNRAGPKLSGDVNAAATIRAVMQSVTGVAPASDNVSFFDAGGDSLGAVTLIDRINREFDVSLNVADIYESPTAAELGDTVNARAGREEWLAVTPINTDGKTAPLYFAYGNAAAISKHLGPDVPLYWVVHGRYGIVFPIASIAELARRHCEQIRARQPHGPYCLVGFSFGALVMIEVARILREEGDGVPILVLIDPTRPVVSVDRSAVVRFFRLMLSRTNLKSKVRFVLGRIRTTWRRRFKTLTRAESEQINQMTLHGNEQIGRDTILAEVSRRLRDHDFRPCPGSAVIFSPSSDASLDAHSLNDRLLWDSLFLDPVEHHAIKMSGAHTEFFGDEGAMQAVAQVVSAKLAGVSVPDS